MQSNMGSNSIGTKSNFTQTINFHGSDTECSAEVVAQDVTVCCSPGDHQNGSSKVKWKNVVDYNWELKYYHGQLIASHVNGKVYAYTIKPKGKCGMFKVINIETDQRTLVKDLIGTVQDIAFALTPQVILGCIDEEGNLYVYSVDDNSVAISCNLLMHVRHPKTDVNVSNYRVIWCPYVPTFGEDPDTLDDPAKLLVFLNGTKAEVWDLSIVNSKYGAVPLEPGEDIEGFVEIDGHTLDVIDASFSPDGTALATASLDGYVKFYQVYMLESEDPRCLHQWQPHDGKALSCLLFLDNIKSYGSDSKFWKFAITGANHNAELKIWSCQSWTCLQTIRFECSSTSLIRDLFFKVSIDMTAEYLLMSDINNRILYILQIQKNEEDKVSSISTISEFLLPASVISFTILNVSQSNLHFSSSEDLYDDEEDYDDENNMKTVSLKLFVVQPKSLKDCIITFKPECSMTSNIKSVYGNVMGISEDEVVDNEVNEMPKLNDLQSTVTLLIKQQTNQPTLNLMTPDDFNSPVLNPSPNNIRNSFVDLTSSSTKKEAVVNLIDFQQPQKDNCASGGSSPSREVQEILALNNPTYTSQEYFDNLTKIDNEETDEIPTNDYNNTDNADVAKSDVWPNIPMMKAYEIEMKEESRRKLDEDNKDKMKLNLRLSVMMGLLKKQSTQIEELEAEIKRQARDFSSVDFNMQTLLRKELDKYQMQTSKMFENHLKEQKHREFEHYDKLLLNISQALGKQVNENLQKMVNNEVQNMLPSILAIFEKLQLQLDVHYSQKLNTIDHLLRSNISKLFNSKTVIDSLTNSIITVVKPALEETYREMVNTTVIPSLEPICTAMFKQIHTTFTEGTKEYTTSVENYMDRTRKTHEKAKDLLEQIQSASEKMRLNTDKLQNSLSEEMHKQITFSFNAMQESLGQVISEVVKEQVRIGFKTHAPVLEDSVVNAVRSRAVTPSPLVIDTQAQISQLHSHIVKGNIDLAFQQALSASASASDVSLVLYVCERVNPQEVFGPPKCILQQHVLLSLVQQLSADLAYSTEVKHKYLQEAILNFDTANPMTKEHLPTVIKELVRQLNNFILTNPNHKNLTNMKMLNMAAKALIK